MGWRWSDSQQTQQTQRRGRRVAPRQGEKRRRVVSGWRVAEGDPQGDGVRGGQVVGLLGLPLDCTDEKLRDKLGQLLQEGGGATRALRRVAVEKNAVGLCETGAAVVAFDAEDDDLAEWLSKKVAAASGSGGFFTNVRCLGGRSWEDSVAPTASARINALSLEQHLKNLQEVERDFKDFENNSY